jgi:hypothetical protein
VLGRNSQREIFVERMVLAYLTFLNLIVFLTFVNLIVYLTFLNLIVFLTFVFLIVFLTFLNLIVNVIVLVFRSAACSGSSTLRTTCSGSARRSGSAVHRVPFIQVQVQRRSLWWAHLDLWRPQVVRTRDRVKDTLSGV